MAQRLVAWKHFYEVTYDGSGVEVSRRWLRKEPIYEEIAEPAPVGGSVEPPRPRIEETSIPEPVFARDVRAKFEDFCREAAHFNPPAPLAFDALRLFKAFEAAQRRPLAAEMRAALAHELNKLERQVAQHQRRLETAQSQLGAAPFRALRKARYAAWTKLRRAKITTRPEPIGKATRQKIDRAARFLAAHWADQIEAQSQGVFSVYQDIETQQTIIQVASGRVGSIFITLPEPLDPIDVARQVLEALREVLSESLDPSDPVAVLNGAFPEINMKELLPGRVVVRSRSDQAAPMMERIATLYARAPLAPENTRIVSAIPASAEALARIELSSADWDLWDGTSQTYATTVAARGFSTAIAVQATAPEFLDALKTKENVIVLVAHARSDCLYFPDGSQVRPSDIEAIRDDIARNKPVVYLFCCETAQYTMAEAISETLLRCGAQAVVAPQEAIRTDQARALLSDFLAHGSRQTPIIGLREAEAATRNLSMETWLG